MLSKLKEKLLLIGDVLPDIIMGGDFNLPKVDWKSGYGETQASCPKVIRDMNETLNNFCNDLYLKQYVNQPTHKDGNLLDLLFTNNSDIISEVNVAETLLSITHHKFIDMETTYKAKYQVTDVLPKFERFQTINFFSNKAGCAGLKDKLSQYNWVSLFENKSSAEILDIFYDICFDACSAFIPKRKMKTGAKTVHPVKKKLLRRRKLLNKRLTRVKLLPKKESLSIELLDIEKQLMVFYRESDQFEEQKAISAIKKNTKYFFKYA